MAPNVERTRRALLTAIALFVITHVVALGAMALVLGPGMDPGASTVDERMAWIASHATTWRLGWLPWQLSAASDLAMCLALIVWALGDAVTMRLAIAALVLDVVGAVPEQWAEAMLVTSFVDASRGDPEAWRAAWSLYAGVTGVWANFAYTLMTACWMGIAARMLGRAVTHAAAEALLLFAFLVSGTLTYFACTGATDADVARWFALSTAANGIAFPSLVLWTCALAWRLRGQSTREQITPPVVR